ncbi:MAG: filamentous hemagglutinin N-terminal domain-containing protein [Candidatus Pacebacteria bacterium]|nr:filamentous hemagglutinin N-terminal domain-containing protein [Candidatus Paceibacterota bacterium]
MRPFTAKQKTLRLAATVATAALLSRTQQAYAAPQGGTVATGTASINSGTNSTVVTQTTDRATIDWQSFNLSQNESVEFIVPNSSSATLNRIHDSRPSTISGSITSNGSVYFTNPNGLVFDATSQVTANGFFAATQTIADAHFMNGGVTPDSLTRLGSKSITLNGTITAPTVRALGGTVTVAGTIESASGDLLISSTHLTTIGAAAVIRLDATQNGNGGKAKVWSDGHTDFFGYISAQGGARSGDGGFVEVSGKSTLNFSGTVTTLATNGKTGTLLLDPSDIVISNDTGTASLNDQNFTSNSKTSIVNVTTLQNALAGNSVTIDATAGSGNGSGSITVNNSVSWSSQNGLTLTAGQGGVKINSTIAGAGRLTINSQGTVTIVPGADWTLDGDITIARAGPSGMVRLDLAGHRLLGGKTITTAQNIYYTSATSGNNATIDVTNGNFTFVNDQRSVTGATPLTNDSTSADWGSGLGSFTAGTSVNGITPFSAGGLTISTNGNIATITNQGVVYGGTVDIQGISTGAAKNLTYIEGSGISLTGAGSGFSGSLTLVANGEGTSVGYGIGGTYDTQGISINSNLTLGPEGTNNLTLIQSGTVTGHGILTKSSTVSAGGNITVIQAGSAGFSGILPYRSTISAGRSLTLIQTGSASLNGIYGYHSRLSAGSGIDMNQSGSAGMNGIHHEVATVSSGGTMNLNQSGSAEQNGIRVEGSTLSAGSTIKLNQSGSAGSDGIAAGYSSLKSSGAGLSLVQSGTIGDGKHGIYLWSNYGSDPVNAMVFAAAKNDFVWFQTRNQILSLNSENNFTVTGGMVRIDLGTAAMISKNDLGRVITLPQYQYSLKASGLDVYFTGSTSENQVKIAVGNGSFTFVNDKRTVTGSVTLDNQTIATTATHGWGAAPTYGTSGSDFTLGGLTIIGTGGLTRLQGRGVVYGSTVDIQGVGSAGQVANGADQLRYIEGAGISVTTNPSSFSGSLVLVSSGSGTAVGSNAGLYIEKNLSVSSNLSLIQTGGVSGNGIVVSSAGLMAGGDLSLRQIGTVGENKDGIALIASGIEAANGQTFTAGANGFVTIKTNNNSLSLNNSDNFTLSAKRLRIDLGSGVMISRDVTGTVIHASANQLTLKAHGVDVYFIGATTGHSARIDVGSGSFTAVIDNRSITDPTTLGTTPFIAPTYGGLTVIGTGPAASRSQVGVIYGGAVTLDGVTTTGAGILSYIEANSITTRGSASNFSGSLKLSTSGAVSLAADVTSGGKIAIEASDLTLTRPITTRGGAVDLTLSGRYSNGSGIGNSWTTSSNNLKLTTQTIEVGSGAVFVLASATLETNAKVLSLRFGDNSYFTNDANITDDATLRAALTAANQTDATAEYHSLSELSSGLSQFGFSGTTGTITYGNVTNYTTAATKVTLWNVTNGAISRQVTAKEVVFAGDNSSFTTGFSLDTSAGNGNVTLKSAVTAAGNLSLNLGGGTYVSNDKKLTAAGKDLAITAAAITATSGTVIFDLKPLVGNSGSLTGNVMASLVTDGAGWSNSYGAITGDPTAATVHYYVTTSAMSDKAGINDANGVWLDAADFVAETPFNYNSGGSKIANSNGGVFEAANGEFKWGAKDYRTRANPPSPSRGMTAGRPVTFVNLGSSNAAYANGFARLNAPSAIDFRGDNSISGDLTVQSAGSITQGQGSSLTVSGGKLVLTAGGEINLNQRSNSIASLGAISANGLVAIASSSSMAVTDNISSTRGAISLTAAGLSLSKNITTSGGALTLDLGKSSLNMNSFELTTSNQNLILTAGTIMGTRVGAEIFHLGEDGRLTPSPNLLPQTSLGEVKYYAYLGGAGDELGDFVSDRDPNGEGVSWNFYSGARRLAYHNSDTVIWLPLAVLTNGYGFKTWTLNQGETSGLKVSSTKGDWLWQASDLQPKVGEVVIAANTSNRDLSFVNVTATDAVKVEDSASIQFVGVNSFNTLNLTSQGRVLQARNSRVSVSGLMTLNRLEALWLTNPLNQFSAITGSTMGGSVSITSNGSGVLNLDRLTTGGGSVVVVAPNGGISGKDLVTGGVHFRAAGAVELNGVMASTSGTGSSISINNKTAGWVVGNLTSDTAVNLKGGGIILTGTVTSRGSSVEIDAPVLVVGEREIIAQSSLDVNRIDAMVAFKDTLKLHAGTAGVINLAANIGAVTKLGWVEFYARDLNRVPTITVNMMSLPPLPSDSRRLRVQ